MDKAYEGGSSLQVQQGELWEYDRKAYKRRNEIERLFRNINRFRRMFTGYNKLDLMYMAYVVFSFIMAALKNVNTPQYIDFIDIAVGKLWVESSRNG